MAPIYYWSLVLVRWLRRHLATIMCAIIFIIGACLLAYPQFSNWWNQQHQSRAIAGYETAVEETDDTEIEAMLAAAEAYNERLLEDRTNGDVLLGGLSESEISEYNNLLDLEGNGVIGYVRIPKIDVELPIYHGTDEATLQVAIGHIEGSSLPVGGTGTHAVISGHRGLPSAKLFTDIDSLGKGDVFMITVLNRKITYQVDQILTVLPDELDALAIDPDEDYCTLVTCTPYGVNSHRLLVRGHRIANLIDEDVETIHIEIPERELSTQEQIQQWLPYIMILAAGFFGLALILPSKNTNRREEEQRRAWEESRKRRRKYRDRRDPDPEWERRRQETMRRRKQRERRHYAPEYYYDDYNEYGEINYDRDDAEEFYDDDEDSWLD